MLCMNSWLKKKKRSGLFGVGGVGVGVGGDICDFSRASQICSLLFCTCFAAEQCPLFIREIFILHLPLASHRSRLGEIKKEKGKRNSQEGSVCSGTAVVFRQDGQMYKHTACLQKGLRLTRSAQIDGGKREREPANGETRGKSCLRRVYSSVNLQGRTDIL